MGQNDQVNGDKSLQKEIHKNDNFCISLDSEKTCGKQSLTKENTKENQDGRVGSKQKNQVNDDKSLQSLKKKNTEENQNRRVESKQNDQVNGDKSLQKEIHKDDNFCISLDSEKTYGKQ